MKKSINKLLFVLFVLVLVVPNMVMAVDIEDSKISGDQTVKTGDTVELNLKLNFSGISISDLNTFGIGGIALDLEYDEDVFKFIEAKANGFNTNYINVDGDRGLLSVITGEDLGTNACTDGILYCGEYALTMRFYVRDTDVSNSKISIGDVAILGWNLKNGTRDSYDEDDMDAVVSSVNKTLEYTIEKVKVTKEEPATITKTENNSSNEVAISNVVTKKAEKQEVSNPTGSKSSNAYLKELNVKGYILNFYKRTKNYEIEVEKGINSLEIDAKLDDDKSLLDIKGADDLKANDYKVEVIVTAEDGSKNTYTITVKEEKEKGNKKITTANILDKIKEIFDKYKIYIIGGGSILLLIIIISVVVNKVSDNKLGKKFDEF